MMISSWKSYGYVLVLVVVFLFGAVPQTLACATCFGDPNSNLSKGVVWGVLVLVSIVACVLAGFTGVGIFWMKRARYLADQEHGSLDSI